MIRGDALAAYGHAPSCCVRRTAAQSIPNNVITNVLFTATRWQDIPSMHSDSVNPDRIYTPFAGKWRISFQCVFPANTTGERYAYLQHSSGAYLAITKRPAGEAGDTYLALSRIWQFGENEFVVAQVLQVSGGALNLTAAASYTPECSLEFVGP